MRQSTGAAWSNRMGAALLLAALLATPASAQERRPSLDRHEARRAALERQRRGALATDADATGHGAAPVEAWSAAVLGRQIPPFGAFDPTFLPPGPAYGWPFAGYHTAGYPTLTLICSATAGPVGWGGHGPGWDLRLHGVCRPVGVPGWFPYAVGPEWSHRGDRYRRGGWPGWRSWRWSGAWFDGRGAPDLWGWTRGRRRVGPAMPYDWPWGWPFVPRHRFEDRYREDEGGHADPYRASHGARVPGVFGWTAPATDPYRSDRVAPGAYAGAGYAAPVDAADCAQVSIHVVHGGVFRGWVSRLHYGTRDPRELELAIDAQLSGGRPVDLLSPDGYRIRVPPTAPVERIVVGACTMNP